MTFRYPNNQQETDALIDTHRARVTITRKRNRHGTYDRTFVCPSEHGHRDMLAACLCIAKKADPQ